MKKTVIARLREAIPLIFFICALSCSLQISAQSMFNAPIYTGSAIASGGAGGGGATCPVYDSIGVLREDTATFVILCCSGGCDTLPLIASPGGGPLALWKLQGNSITQVNANNRVFIADSFAIQVGNTSAYFYPGEIGYYIEGNGDSTIYVETDTSLELIAIRPGDHRTSLISQGHEVFMTKRIPLDNATLTWGIDSTRAYLDYDLDAGTDTVLANFFKNGAVQFTELSGSGTRYVTATSTGYLQTSAAPYEIFANNTVEVQLPDNITSNVIYIDTIPANTIDSGDIVEITVWGVFAANNHERIVTISFNSGASSIPFTGTTTINGLKWNMHIILTPNQDDLTVASSTTSFNAGNGDLNTTPVFGVNTDPQQFDFTQDNIIEILGQTDTGGATGDIIFYGFIITIQR